MPKKSVTTKKKPIYKKSLFKKNTSATHSTGKTALQEAVSKTPLFPISKLIRNQLYYTEKIINTGTASSIIQKFFSGNGLWDPDFTGVGHQPMGFDQMMLMYEHYSCIRSKITINFVNASASPVRVGIMLSPDTVALSNLQKIMENGLVKTLVLDSNTNKSTGQLTLNCDISKYFGRKSKRDIIDDVELKGSSAANPLEQVYYTVFAFSPFGSTEDITVGMDVMISYDAVYTEPRKLDPS